MPKRIAFGHTGRGGLVGHPEEPFHVPHAWDQVGTEAETEASPLDAALVYEARRTNSATHEVPWTWPHYAGVDRPDAPDVLCIR